MEARQEFATSQGEIGAKLLTSTSRELILWDGRATSILSMYDPNFIFYGITWSPDETYVACGYNIHTLDRQLETGDKVPINRHLQGTHQIYWYDGKLYIMESLTNQILVWDGKDLTSVEHYRNTEGDPHINSIWCDGKLFYVTEHWRNQLPKVIHMFDMEWNSVAAQMSWDEQLTPGIHNAYMEDDTIITLGPGIVKMFFKTPTDNISYLKERTFMPAYMGGAYFRGFARTADHYYIGVSELGDKEKRHLGGDAAVLVYDNNWDMTGRLILKNTGQLLDIRCIEPLDLAHNGVEW
jgi:hypothetical protein